MLGATVLTALEAELVSEALEATAESLGLTPFFLRITLGSSIQIALLVAPVLVLVSFALGKPMNLVFENPLELILELIAIAGTAFAVNAIAQDGETTSL